MEVRISDDWDIIIHAHGRKVYPESLQINYVDHSVRGVREVCYYCIDYLFTWNEYRPNFNLPIDFNIHFAAMCLD